METAKTPKQKALYIAHYYLRCAKDTPEDAEQAICEEDIDIVFSDTNSRIMYLYGYVDACRTIMKALEKEL